MKILYLTSEAFFGRGGIAQYNRDVLHALASHPGCKEIVAIPRKIVDRCEPVPEKVKYVVPGESKGAFVRTVVRVLREAPDFNLVICGHINLLPVAAAAGSLIGAPLLLLIYGIDAWTVHESWLVKQSLRRVGSVISISEITLERFLEWSGIPRSCTHVLPNAIDLGRYRPGHKPRHLMERYGIEDGPVIMTMGRMSSEERYKGFDEVLDALPEIRRTIPSVRYIIVGDGSDRPRLEQKARSLGLGDSVVFTGYIAEEEKVEHYWLADVYVMPSYGEGFGFVFLEAMACGVPVIGGRGDGGREALRGGMLGRLVEPKNRNELVSAILDALKEGVGDVPEGLGYFSYENFARRLHRLINRVIVS